MTCAPFVIAPETVLGRHDTVAHAARQVAANAFTPLPVLDEDRRVLGLFGPRELAALLLPMGARLAGEGFGLGFVSEAPAALQERLAAVAADTVGQHLTPHMPIHARTSLDEALRRMHRGATVQVVVDDDGRLVGLLTAAGLLAPLVEGL